MKRPARPVALAVLAATLIAAGGCAYFNTLYNARQKYREALEIKRKADPERLKISTQEETLYKEAFERAALVVKYWPDSKWVDDALLLMGKASLEKGDYSTALRKFDEILTIFPDSPLAPEARLLKGRTLILTKDYPGAVVELNLAREGSPEKLLPDVLHHLGIVRREEGDVDGALAAFREVVSHHRGSEWFAPAGIAAGDLERDRGNLAEAVGFYEKVRAKGHTAEEKYLGGIRKGDALVKLGELDRARRTYRDVAKGAANEERRGTALLAEAHAVAEAGDREGAAKLYGEIVAAYPRKEAAAEAQFQIAKLRDDAGDLAGAKEQYELVKEQGTGHEAWQRATARATDIQQVLDLREVVASEGPDQPRSRYLLAELLLEKIGDTDAALTEYATLAEEAKGTEWGAKALYAQAWVLENRLKRQGGADSVLFRLANGYAGTEADAFARRRLGYPVWKVEKIEAPKVVFIRSEGQTGAPSEVVLERVEPKPVALPPDVSEVEVWVRVGLGRDGSVEETKVVKSGGAEFDEASLSAARASRFLPPDEGGPVITVVQYVFPPPAQTPPAGGSTDEAGTAPEVSRPAGAADSTGAPSLPSSSLPPDASAPPDRPTPPVGAAADSLTGKPVIPPPDSSLTGKPVIPPPDSSLTGEPPAPPADSSLAGSSTAPASPDTSRSPGTSPPPSIRDLRLDRDD